MKLGFIAHNHLEGIEADCRFCVEHGFSGLEFNYWANFKDLTADLVGQMRAILDRHGVECSTIGAWGWNHISPDADERAESLRQLDRLIEFGQILGAPVIITGGGEIPGAELSAKVDAFAEIFPPYVSKAAAAGQKIALYAVHGNSFFTTIEAYQRVWEKVPEVGIKYDPANIQHAGLDYLAWLRHHAARMPHVHIKEHLNHEGRLVSQPAAGMGDIHWGKVMAFLYEAGYDGYLTIEPHGSIWSRDPMRKTMLLLTQRHINQFLL